jgi:hypothetical protein
MTAALPMPDSRPTAPVRARLRDDDLFGVQPTGTADLPDPRPLLENLSRCVIEAYAGARDIEQLIRWVTDEVYRRLLTRVVLASRARQAKGVTPKRPQFTIGSTHLCSPRDGVVEAVVTIHARSRARAVAIRLEGMDGRWRASAISVL